MLDKIEKEAIVNRWLLSNPPVLKTTVLKAQEDIAKLLNYIAELENMPLVQTVVNLQEALKLYSYQKNWEQLLHDQFAFNIDTPDETMWHFDEHPWEIAKQALKEVTPNE